MADSHSLHHPNETPVLSVNGFTFDEEVLQCAVPVLVDVTAAWCPPCRAAEPVIEEMARQWLGKLKVVRVAGEDSPDLVARLGVRGFPTFLLYAAGQEVGRQAGFAGAQSLRRLVGADMNPKSL